MENTKKEAIGLLVTMNAKTGKAPELKDFLFNGLPLVLGEPETLSWFAFQIDEHTFGIYDTFEVEAGRQAHLKGEVAKALLAQTDNLLVNFDANRNIQFVDVIATNHKFGKQHKGLLAIMNAKTGKSDALEAFLRAGKQIVTDEPATLSWYALKLSDSTYAIFDTFTDDSGRHAHLNGAVAAALLEHAAVLLHDFKTTAIQPVNIIAYKPMDVLAYK